MDLADLLFAAFAVGGSLLIWFYIKSRVTKQKRVSQVWREFAMLNNLEEKPGKGETWFRYQCENQGMPFVLECIETEGTPVRVGNLELSRGLTLLHPGQVETIDELERLYSRLGFLAFALVRS